MTTFTGNNDTRKADLFKAVFELGKAEGKGKNSRPEFGMKAFMAAADGVVYSTDGKKAPDDVKPLYAKYLAGLEKRADYAGFNDTCEKSVKVQVSKLRQLVIVGGHPMFSTARDGGTSTVAKDFIELVDARIINLAKQSTKAVPIYDKIVSVMRAQREKIKAGKLEPLDQDEIDAAIVSKASDPEELKTIRAAMGRLRKLAEGDLCAKSAEYLLKAADALQPRVNELERLDAEEDLEETLAEISDEQIAAILAKRAQVTPEMKIAAE